MRAFKTFLILSHRYIGIPLSFMFVLWFVSGFFMIYTGGMPKVTPEMQIDASEPLDFAKVSITPAQAISITEYDAPAAKLRTILGRPVYELGDPGYNSAFVYADTGELMPPLSVEQSAELASRFLAIPLEQFHFAETLEEHTDQWTFTVQRDLPLHKFTVNDGLGTQVYVSTDNAVVSAYTTSKSRLFAWLGTIPHWLYFEGLRDNQPLWYQLIVWSATLGCISALLGLCLGLTQFRKVRPFVLKRAIPYQGLMRWHYILGSLFGVVTLTWVFSGLVSMEPWAWTNASGVPVSQVMLSQSELKLAQFPALNSVAWQQATPHAIKELSFNRVLGQPYLLASYTPYVDDVAAKRDRLHQPYNINGQLAADVVVIDAATGKPQAQFAEAKLVAALDGDLQDTAVTEATLLQEYDDYYYSRGNQLPLPVLRIKFDDANASWVYVDPQQGQVLSLIHKYSRLERWLYSGLHSLDFAFWYHRRPLWDIGVLLLMTGGLATSVLGLYFGLRRLRSDCGLLLNKVLRKKSAQEVSHGI
jgi:hypothetical protein